MFCLLFKKAKGAWIFSLLAEKYSTTIVSFPSSLGLRWGEIGREIRFPILSSSNSLPCFDILPPWSVFFPSSATKLRTAFFALLSTCLSVRQQADVAYFFGKFFFLPKKEQKPISQKLLEEVVKKEAWKGQSKKWLLWNGGSKNGTRKRMQKYRIPSRTFGISHNKTARFGTTPPAPPPPPIPTTTEQKKFRLLPFLFPTYQNTNLSLSLSLSLSHALHKIHLALFYFFQKGNHAWKTELERGKVEFHLLLQRFALFFCDAFDAFDACRPHSSSFHIFMFSFFFSQQKGKLREDV